MISKRARGAGVLALVFGAGLSPWGCAEEPAPARIPHVLIVYVDDMGFGDAGFLGSELATPHIDSIAREGIVLERFYASPMCTPSRAQLLTGRYASRMGLDDNVNLPDEHGLPPEEVTLAELLRDAGYATHLVGKWHLGHRDPKHHPLRHGFDSFYGMLTGWIDYETHERDGALDWYRGETPFAEEGYSTELIAHEGARLIRAHPAGTPLFLYVTFNAPHFPLHRAPGREPDSALAVERGQYATMLGALDDAVGELLVALEESGLRRDTLLLFASDNGGSVQHGASNAPLRGFKFSAAEGSIRVPAAIAWPAQLKPGRSAQVITNLDVLPTVCAAAGIGLEHAGALDGQDLLAELRGGVTTERGDLFFGVQHFNTDRSALLRGRHKLLEIRRPNGPSTYELFDVFADPGERRELSRSEPELFGELRSAHDKLARDVGFRR
jgi:arylsulfatase A-like enzyme